MNLLPSFIKGSGIGRRRLYIITDENMKTNIYGVFAAGDISRKYLRQVVTAAADGAIAAVQAPGTWMK
jgi:thioredoxin reductase